MPGGQAHDAGAPPRPVTYNDAEALYRPGIYKARQRFDELTGRDVIARAIAKLKASGGFDPASHPDPASSPSLTLDERLELLALGEVIARYYQHPAAVHHAVESGASWAQVAAARGTDEAMARRDYRAWADSQHHLWLSCKGRFGLDDAGYDAAVARAEGATDPGHSRRGSGPPGEPADQGDTWDARQAISDTRPGL